MCTRFGSIFSFILLNEIQHQLFNCRGNESSVFFQEKDGIFIISFDLCSLVAIAQRFLYTVRWKYAAINEANIIFLWKHKLMSSLVICDIVYRACCTQRMKLTGPKILWQQNSKKKKIKTSAGEWFYSIIKFEQIQFTMDNIYKRINIQIPVNKIHSKI